MDGTADGHAVDGRFRQLFEQVPLGVALSSLDGRFTEVNQRFRDLLAGTGIDPDHAGLADLARHLPDDSDEASRWRDGLAEVLAGRAPVARAELEIAPPGAPPRRVRATTALVVLGEDRCLVSHVENVEDIPAPRPASPPADRSAEPRAERPGERPGERPDAPTDRAPEVLPDVLPDVLPELSRRLAARLGAVARRAAATFLVKHHHPRPLAGRDAHVTRSGRRT